MLACNGIFAKPSIKQCVQRTRAAQPQRLAKQGLLHLLYHKATSIVSLFLNKNLSNYLVTLHKKDSGMPNFHPGFLYKFVYFACLIEREILPLPVSTPRTFTETTSPTLKASLGCLM